MNEYNILFNDSEINAMFQIMEMALKSSGLSVAEATVHFMNKFKEAVAAKQAQAGETPPYYDMEMVNPPVAANQDQNV